MDALKETKLSLRGQTSFYKGKVRDVYTVNNSYLVMVVSDRISAFDVVLPEPVPYKGQVLNQIASKALMATQDIVANWILDVPDPNVTIGRVCEPFKVEMVIRGYLAGHAWREYKEGKRSICGVTLPEGLKENQKLPQPIITPTTKADFGHDEDISKKEIIERGIVSAEDYELLESFTKALFMRGSDLAAEHGLILVDTKYEFGKAEGRIYLIDEIHTPDSSRYFYSNTYYELLNSNMPQRQLSKEFVRQWLIENGFQGREGEKTPLMSAELIKSISERYIELYETITGEPFRRVSYEHVQERILNNIEESLKRLN